MPEPLDCAEAGCSHAAFRRELCSTHYRYWREARADSCSVEDCGRDAYVRGFCTAHYQRWLKYGDPIIPPRPCAHCGKEFRPLTSDDQRFCSRDCGRRSRPRALPAPLPNRPCDVCQKSFQPRARSGRFCSRTCSDQWRKADPQKRAQRTEWQRAHDFRRNYGITIEEYRRLHDAQDGRCAVCGGQEDISANSGNRVKNLSVDHDHDTGRIRELLCGRCNTGLGWFSEDVELLSAAIAYLQKHELAS